MNKSFALAILVISTGLLIGQMADADNQGTAVWIDTDPACDSRFARDVDDCWALLLALGLDSLDIRGISTVFGNDDEPESHATLIRLIENFARRDAIPSVHRGATEPIGRSVDTKSSGNLASRAMAAALAQESLTIIALGPLTNVATLVRNYPQPSTNITRIIAVAGQRPQQNARIFPGDSRLFHVHDFNFRKDVKAAEIVLTSSIPVTLVPFEAARQIGIGHSDLAVLAGEGPGSEWLSDISVPWLRFWNIAFRADNFHPFDALAVGLVSWPQLFTCQDMAAWIEYRKVFFVDSRDRLLVAHASRTETKGKPVKYCYDVSLSFKTKLLTSLP